MYREDTGDIDTPDSSIVAIEGPQSLSIVGVPDCRLTVFGH